MQWHLLLLPWACGWWSTAVPSGPHSGLPLIPTAPCDEATQPGGRRVGSDVIWDSTLTYFTSQWMARIFCQENNKTLYPNTSIKHFLESSMETRDAFKGGEHRNSLGTYLSSFKKSLLLSSPLLLCTGRQGSLRFFNSLFIASAHFNLHAFACENYLPQLPN